MKEYKKKKNQTDFSFFIIFTKLFVFDEGDIGALIGILCEQKEREGA